MTPYVPELSELPEKRPCVPNGWRLLFLSLVLAQVLAVGMSVFAPAALATPPPPPVDPVAAVFHGFDIPAAAATAIVTGSITPSARYPIVAYAITISVVSTDSVLNWTSTDSLTGTKYTDALNSATALTAGSVYTFLVGARRDLDNSAATMSYNLECATATGIGRLQVDEVRSDVR